MPAAVPPQQSPVRIVSPYSDTAYPTIAEALHGIEPGNRIEVYPGIYTDPLVIDAAGLGVQVGEDVAEGNAPTHNLTPWHPPSGPCENLLKGLSWDVVHGEIHRTSRGVRCPVPIEGTLFTGNGVPCTRRDGAPLCRSSSDSRTPQIGQCRAPCEQVAPHAGHSTGAPFCYSTAFVGG